jgi:GT2 family glycosyltransferase
MAQISQKDLAVIIVSWNVRDILLKNLETLSQSKGVNFEIIVVDNHSKDGTVHVVRSDFPQVKIIANTENHGFSKACNQGIDASNARHILLLNPDMLVEADALAKTVAYLDAHSDVAVVSGKLLNKHGKPIHHFRRFPTIGDQLAVMFKLGKLFPKLLHSYHAIDLDPDYEQQVDTVRGSYFAINRTALDLIGKLDERYYIWFEEVDYCKRAQSHKMKVMYVPSIIAHDLVGQSFKQRHFFWKQSHFLRSMLSYFEKWHPGWRVWVIRLARPTILVAAKIADLVMY